MKTAALVVVLALMILSVSFVFGQTITNEDLERKYGPGNSYSQTESGSGDPCTVVNYDIYDDSRLHTNPSYVTNFGKTGVVTGGNVVQSKTTYMTVTIKNNTQNMKRVSSSDISVRTIKGNTVSPSGGEIVYIGAGETKTLDGLLFRQGLSQAISIKCSCY